MLNYDTHEYLAYLLVLFLTIFLAKYAIKKDWKGFEVKPEQKVFLLSINIFFGIMISVISGDFFWTISAGYRDIFSRPLFILTPAFPSGAFGSVVSTLLLISFPTKWKEISGLLYACFFVSAVMALCLLAFEPFSLMDVDTSIFLGILNGMYFGAASGFVSGLILRYFEKNKFNNFALFLVVLMLVLIFMFILSLSLTLKHT